MMRDLIRLLTAAVEQKLAHEVPQLVRRLLLRLLAGVFGLAAFVCLLDALWIALIPKVGPVGAPAIIAGVLVLAALICLALSHVRRRVVIVTTSVPPQAAADPASMFRDNKAAILAALFTAAFERGSRR